MGSDCGTDLSEDFSNDPKPRPNIRVLPLAPNLDQGSDQVTDLANHSDNQGKANDSRSLVEDYADLSQDMPDVTGDK